jgi:hypothetical protein
MARKKLDSVAEARWGFIQITACGTPLVETLIRLEEEVPKPV